MGDVLKALLAVISVAFFLALGAFGGCVAGLSTQGGSGIVIGLVIGGIVGIWVGILIVGKLFNGN